MSNFWQRLITGFFFIVILLGAVLWNQYSFVGLFFLICVFGLREYALLFKGREHKPDFWGTVLGGGGIALIWALLSFDSGKTYFSNHAWLLIIGCLLLPVFIDYIRNEKLSLNNIGLSLIGIIYINIGFLSFVLLRIAKIHQDCLNVYPNRTIVPVIGFLILQWSSDTFAYLTGRAFGKTPLAPKISPKKTWEGSIGGGVCTIGVSIVLFYTMGYLELHQWIGMAIVIHIFGTFGDLIESKLKRTLGVKDSGNILPGHGGILDRFDSLLFAAPFVLIFLVISNMF
jgi:phosphatidate cytidylyltransferase